IAKPERPVRPRRYSQEANRKSSEKSGLPAQHLVGKHPRRPSRRRRKEPEAPLKAPEKRARGAPQGAGEKSPRRPSRRRIKRWQPHFERKPRRTDMDSYPRQDPGQDPPEGPSRARTTKAQATGSAQVQRG